MRYTTLMLRKSTKIKRSLPDNTEGTIADGPIRLHFRRAWHLASRVAVGLRYRRPTTRASSQRRRVTRRPRGGRGSRQARRGAQAGRRGSSRRVNAEVLVAQLRAGEQVSTDRLSTCPVEGHARLRTPELSFFADHPDLFPATGD